MPLTYLYDLLRASTEIDVIILTSQRTSSHSQVYSLSSLLDDTNLLSNIQAFIIFSKWIYQTRLVYDKLCLKLMN